MKTPQANPASQFLIQQLHQEACLNEQDTYLDPETGFSVMTAFYLEQRGFCCENRCRHCPYSKKSPQDISQSGIVSDGKSNRN